MKRTYIGGKYVLAIVKHPRSGYPVDMELVNAIPINEQEEALERYNEWVAQYQDEIHSVMLMQRYRQLYRSGNKVQIEYSVALKPVGDAYSKYWTFFNIGWERKDGKDFLTGGERVKLEVRDWN